MRRPRRWRAGCRRAARGTASAARRREDDVGAVARQQRLHELHLRQAQWRRADRARLRSPPAPARARTTPGTIGRPGKWPGRLGWSAGNRELHCVKTPVRAKHDGAAVASQHGRRRGADCRAFSAAIVAPERRARAAPSAAGNPQVAVAAGEAALAHGEFGAGRSRPSAPTLNAFANHAHCAWLTVSGGGDAEHRQQPAGHRDAAPAAG